LYIFIVHKSYLNINKKKEKNMKKILAILSIVALTSCGTGTSTEVKTDSTAVVADSTKVDSTVVSVDSAKAEAPNAVEVK